MLLMCISFKQVQADFFFSFWSSLGASLAHSVTPQSGEFEKNKIPYLFICKTFTED